MTKFELYENFSRNIEIERMKLGYTQQKMADVLGISLSKYKIIISNPCEANIDIFLSHKVYEITGVTVRELCGDNPAELEMLKAFRELPKHRQDAIMQIIDVERQLSRKKTTSTNDHASTGKGAKNKLSDNNYEADFVTVFIPTGNMEDGMMLDSRNFDTIDISDYKKRSNVKIDCAVKVTSNHLHPVYSKGDILLVSKRAPRDGDTGIFIRKDNHRIFIREFKQTNPCELRSINGFGETLYVDSNNPADMANWIKFGTVITVLR